MSSATGTRERAAMRVHQGDVVAGALPYISSTGLLVTGSVCIGARIKADGDVFIRGSVDEAAVMSTSGRIAVAGQVTGTILHRSVLYAGSDVTCGSLLHAEVQAGGDIRLLAVARHAMLRANGDLYLPHSLEQSLLDDVRMNIDGSLVLGATGSPRYTSRTTERQHVRATVRLAAELAYQGAPPLRFHAGTVDDISAGGVRFRFSDKQAVAEATLDTLVQLKIELPDKEERVHLIARVVRAPEGSVTGLQFLQVSDHDRRRLKAFCLQLVLDHRQAKIGARGDRGVSEYPQRDSNP